MTLHTNNFNRRQPEMLFNLADDVGERTNLLEHHPERVKEMLAILREQVGEEGRLRGGRE